MTQIKTAATLITGYPLAVAAVAAAALVAVVLAWRQLRRVLAGRQAEDVLSAPA